MSADECCGFADCPCRRCRQSRKEHTAAHPAHGHVSQRSYCGTCRTEEIGRHYRPSRA